MLTEKEVILLILISILYLWITFVIWNGYATSKIQEQLKDYQAVARNHGLDFSQCTPTDTEIAPCNVKFKFEGQKVNAELPSRIALRLLNQMKKGKLDISYLGKKSNWSHRQLPS